jgi:hypothetical protein
MKLFSKINLVLGLVLGIQLILSGQSVVPLGKSEYDFSIGKGLFCNSSLTTYNIGYQKYKNSFGKLKLGYDIGMGYGDGPSFTTYSHGQSFIPDRLFPQEIFTAYFGMAVKTKLFSIANLNISVGSGLGASYSYFKIPILNSIDQVSYSGSLGSLIPLNGTVYRVSLSTINEEKLYIHLPLRIYSESKINDYDIGLQSSIYILPNQLSHVVFALLVGL